MIGSSRKKPLLITTYLEWIIPFVMIPVVARRHLPAAALAWLIFIFFKPWTGVFLYLLIGENIVIRQRLTSYCQRLKEIRSLDRLSLQTPHIFHLPTDPNRLRLVEFTERVACMPVLRGNSVELLDDGCHVIDRIIADIDAAKSHVHFLFYIFKDDEVGRIVAKALARAAGRGVHCRVAVDAFGSRSLNRSLAPWMIENGVELHTLMPVNPFRRHLTRLDLRNHRKLVIIDGVLGYTGSQNIENQNYDRSCPEAWHDLMVRVIGPAVIQLQLVFVEDWYFATGDILDGPSIFPDPPIAGEVPIQVMPSGPIDPTTALRDLLIAAIYDARERVTITSPYFIPDEPFLVALHTTSLKGVQVHLVIPRHTDHPVVGAVARAYIDSLLGSGVNVHFHRGVLHAKTMSVDDTIAVVGTANFDHRSFALHSELTLLLYGQDIVRRLRAKQTNYLDHSLVLDFERWSNRSRLRKLRDQTLKLLSPLL